MTKNKRSGKNITIKYTTKSQIKYQRIISAGGELKTYYFKLILNININII